MARKLTEESIYIRRRLEAVAGLVALGFILLLVRAVDLQWIQADELQQTAEKQRFRQYQTAAPRGPIVDHRGRTLAESIEVPSIAAIASEIPQHRLAELAAALNISTTKLKSKIGKRKGFIWLARQVSPAQAEQVLALNIPGVRQETEWQRFHPLGPETGHLLGFVGIDGHGLEGVERHFDQTLSGHSGIRQVRRDARGHSLPGGVWLDEPDIGQELRLTLDSSIQSIAYAALADGIRLQQAKGGSVIVMRPNDGAILAMASWPGYNPNNFRYAKPAHWRNRAITDMFEPGSTLKPFTLAAALQTGQWQPSSLIFCENGNFRVADHNIHDDHSEGWLDLTHVLARSSNIGAAKLALEMGSEHLHQTLIDVGFKRRTGINLSGESPGILPPLGRWGPVETANIAFGQGIAVTPLQLATAFCVFANGGKRVQPHLIADMALPNTAQVFSSKVAHQVLMMLEAATGNEGTGSKAVPVGYRAAGKTGTAQKADNKGGYEKDKYTATFIGTVPVDKPELVIVVVVDEPQKSIYGGQVAAPIFRNIAAAVLPYMGIAPSIIPDSSNHWMQIRNHSDDAMPLSDIDSFIALSLREARMVAHQRGLQLHTHGSGWVTRQQPIDIAELTSGQRVEVWLNE